MTHRTMIAVEQGLVALDSIVHVLPGRINIGQRRFGDWFIVDPTVTLPDGIRLADSLKTAHRISGNHADAVLDALCGTEVVHACERPFVVPRTNHVALVPWHAGEAAPATPEGVTRLSQPAGARRDPKEERDEGMAWVYYGAESFAVGGVESLPVHPKRKEG